MKGLAAVALGLLVTVAAAAQAGLTGRWEGHTGNAQLVLDVTAKGANLTGTLTRDGQSAPITDGTVTKTTFKFKSKLNDRDEAFSGELAGDEIKLWLDRQGAERAIVLKRVKK
jgi:hypothetical protein